MSDFIFDGPNKLIVCNPGVTSIDVPDLWSRWVDWVLTGDNSKYLPAFRSVGSDPINPSAGTSVPFFCFLINGWKVRPQEATHTLSVGGAGILLVDGGGDPFVDTIGSFIVRIVYQQPVQVIAIATGGGGVDFTTTDRAELFAVRPAISAIPESFTSSDRIALNAIQPAIASSAITASDIWQHIVDGALSAEQSIRLINAVLAGKVSGAGTGIEKFRNPADTKDRLVSTVDPSGNRTSITTDLT